METTQRKRRRNSSELLIDVEDFLDSYLESKKDVFEKISITIFIEDEIAYLTYDPRKTSPPEYEEREELLEVNFDHFKEFYLEHLENWLSRTNKYSEKELLEIVQEEALPISEVFELYSSDQRVLDWYHERLD